MTALLSVGPTDPAEDERRMASGYRRWAVPILGAVPLTVAYFADTKWVIAIGFSVALGMIHESGGRLHDLCIRLRRTNVILSGQNSN